MVTVTKVSCKFYITVSLFSSVGGGERDCGQRLHVVRAYVCHPALPGRADGGDGNEPEGGRAPGRLHDTTAGAGGWRTTVERKRSRPARPIRWLYALCQGWLMWWETDKHCGNPEGVIWHPILFIYLFPPTFQTFPNLSSPPPTKDWSDVSVNSDLGTGTIYRSLAALVESFQEELETIAETGQWNAKHKASLQRWKTTKTWTQSRVESKELKSHALWKNPFTPIKSLC